METAMDTGQTPTEQRPAWRQASVSEIAEAIEHVGEAFRTPAMAREALLEYRRRFKALGLEGLRGLPPQPAGGWHEAPAAEVVARILDICLDRPDYGPRKVNEQLRLEGIWVTTPAIQSILEDHGLATRRERLLGLELKHLREHRELTPEQVRLIERANPCFAERHFESTRPGMLLAQDVFYAGRLEAVGKVYVEAVVDTYSSYAFGFLHPAKLPEAAAAVLHNSVLPFFHGLSLSVDAIVTGPGHEYCGSTTHTYELYLALNGIVHRRAKNREPYVNGFLEDFRRALLDELIRGAFGDGRGASIGELQTDLDAWLAHYNQERPHPGYRNLGLSPIESIRTYAEGQGRQGSGIGYDPR